MVYLFSRQPQSSVKHLDTVITEICQRYLRIEKPNLHQRGHRTVFLEDLLVSDISRNWAVHEGRRILYDC